MLNQGTLAFTYCQVPVIYVKSNENKIVITFKDCSEEEIEGNVIGEALSKSIFLRDDKIRKIKVLFNSQELN